uniref:PUM-HD domain-containing protein n=1 Tax=Grammatophora oceanica TaxID=210454 RepID=A0A7S1VIA4_9STRA|mmetsp:Transcript_47094/g.70033  ORF Transcript_47094/g.70033 Transcript_47094/m.70033 type:complete len:871 (+) Transcript_47094:507-3119(+)|eukprot:CAMPEP_0194065602 /NCGR_PEP_ID=MMETSP0009_2-20130614/85560_1 /TAXON_ID=210454 /ORGANISM="Grammatophora oceanica, Strain CCMP 410" /LENGTH=870 /DNA_ID=CAMNT_0038718465 /DNA_START=507 /DNA_END=3119 /DNA_ORIENTATION=-
MTPGSNAETSSPSASSGRQTYEGQSDVIGSLGDALTGMNLNGGASLLGQPFEKQGNSSTGVNWGSSPAPATSTSQATGSLHNGQRVPSSNNLLFGTDLNDLARPQAGSPVRKKSLELFLSQSPSRTLGQEVINLQQLTSGGATNGSAAEPQSRAPGPIAAPGNSSIGSGRKVDSPLGSGTGTSASSRSQSPSLYNSTGNESDHQRTPRTIPSYDTNRAFTSNPTTQAAGQQPPPPQSQFTTNGSDGAPFTSRIPSVPDMQRTESTGGYSQTGFDHQQSQQPHPPQVHHLQQPASLQPQVLYMAVPTPDGRGQMLQPVQMVQIPGQQATFVMPQQNAIPQLEQPQMMVIPTPQLGQQSGGALNSGLDAGRSSWQASAPSYGVPDGGTNQYGIDTSQGRSDYRVASSGGLGSSPPGISGPSSPSDAIASLYSAPQRPPLDALLGHVRRLSRDQVGCRLLQQALDEEGPMAATLILNEGISFWGEAMVDPFGNYLFQKILEKISAEERISLIKSVSARLVNASLNLHGTRSVQKVVELCAIDEVQCPEAKDGSDGTAAEILTRSLTPAAARLCIDSHGNHVIQRILLKLNHEHARFVFDAVATSVGDVARHRHGCCVIQRCLDSPTSEARSHLVHRIVEKCLELMQDAYGNYVVQYVLDVCGDDDVHAVCESVVGRVCLLAIQKFSSNVMEKCLERCTDRVKEEYLNELSDPERIRELMMDPFGNYVVQRALSVATHSQAVRLVEAMRPHLIASQPGNPHGQRNGGMRNTAGGRRIMAKICRRFPNFTLTSMGTQEELYSQKQAHHKRPHHAQMGYMNGHHQYGGHHHPHQPNTMPPYGPPSQHRGAAPQYIEAPSPGYFDPMRSGPSTYHQM